MANPQAENGYTKIANELMEALVKTRIPGEARQVLDLIFRKTYGFNKKEDSISLSQFCLFTGINKPHVCRSLTQLKTMNLITQKGNSVTNIYSINKDFDTWKPLPKKVTLPKKVICVAEKGNLPLPKKVHTKETLTKAIITKDTYGDFVKLTSDEYDRLCSEFTKQATDKFIEEVNEVFHMKPKVKKEYLNGDHNRLIRNWKRKGYFDNSQKGGNNGTHQNTGRAVGEIDYSIDRGK